MAANSAHSDLYSLRRLRESGPLHVDTDSLVSLVAGHNRSGEDFIIANIMYIQSYSYGLTDLRHTVISLFSHLLYLMIQSSRFFVLLTKCGISIVTHPNAPLPATACS